MATNGVAQGHSAQPKKGKEEKKVEPKNLGGRQSFLEEERNYSISNQDKQQMREDHIKDVQH